MPRYPILEVIDKDAFRQYRQINTRLLAILGILHRIHRESFRAMLPLRWDEGQAVLMSDRRDVVERTSPSAQIAKVPESDIWVDIGHDLEATMKFVQKVMRELGYPAHIAAQVARAIRPEGYVPRGQSPDVDLSLLSEM